MLYNIITLIAGFIPVGFIIWYLIWVSDSAIYKKDCYYSFAGGALCCLAIIGITYLINFLWEKFGFHDAHPLLSAFLKDFIILAFTEEFIKHYMIIKSAKKYVGAIAKHELIAFGGIIGAGFDIVEYIAYFFGSEWVSILVRGITMPHVAYGLLMGWFISKVIEKKNKLYIIPAILIPVIIQGLYDFSLSSELKAYNLDIAAAMTVTIVVFEFTLLVVMLVLIGFSEKKQREKDMVIETERLILRPWREDDARACFIYASNPLIGPIAGWPVHKSEEESREIIKNVLMARETYAICLKSTGELIGSIGLKFRGNTDFTDKSDECELGYWIGQPFWGNGYMTEAAKALIKHAFEDLKVTKIWAGYYDGNEKSKRVQEKCGFKYVKTVNDLYVPKLDETRIGHANVLEVEDWKNNI